jgi:CheY-like chemotaxis protein
MSDPNGYKPANQNSLRLERSLTLMEKRLVSVIDAPRALVVDDDPLTSALLTSIENEGGYRVVQVSHGREAYRILKTDANFRVAIFDLTMPHLKTTDLVRYMKTEKRLMRIPVVVTTGTQGLKNIAESFTAGALAFLPKPFTAAQLDRIMRLVICANREVRREMRSAA